jgi:SAM-dependent methyltransferase
VHPPVTRNARAHIGVLAQAREYLAAVDRIEREVDGPLLDWGCGLGQLTVLLRSRGLDVTSFDWDPTVDGTVKRPLPRFPEVEAWRSDEPVGLPFEDDRFDAVLSMGVLEHVHDPDGSLEELRRVLRPGGLLWIFKLPNRASYLEWIARRAGMYHHGVGEHDRLYALDEAVALVERHGFVVREARRANMLPLSVPQLGRRRLQEGLWRANRVLERVPGLERLATNVELVAVAPR